MTTTVGNNARFAYRPRIADTQSHEVVDQAGTPEEIVTEILGYSIHKIANPSQAWFWSSAWQAKEAEVDAELASGHFRRFDNGEDFLADLDSDE